MLAGLGATIAEGVHIGVGVDLLYTARFTLIGTLKGTVSNTEEGEPQTQAVVDLHETSLEASPAGAYILGVQWDVPYVRDLRIGLAYRTALSNPMEVDLDLQVDGSLAGMESFNDQNISIIAPVSLSLLDFYKPAELSGWIFLGSSQATWSCWRHTVDTMVKGFLNTIQVSQGELSIPMLYENPNYCRRWQSVRFGAARCVVVPDGGKLVMEYARFRLERT